MFRLLLSLIIFALLAAYLTKPSEENLEAQIGTLLQKAVQDGQLDQVSDPAALLLLAACKSDANACARLARSAMDVTYQDRHVFLQVDASGFGREMTCYGVYTKLICPGGP
ncbi:hypothetical protein [Aestuariibius sp. HNIBRBA575]|uniref:hypothetical protein n=1 Tax=Aestuariibius sp. HNIBRBA575 TaxID=3233343 RepID=UPI0034A49481